eukprot:COSAG05_NODE_6067_length_1028_cov_1.214209_1_plen_148_part_00
MQKIATPVSHAPIAVHLALWLHQTSAYRKLRVRPDRPPQAQVAGWVYTTAILPHYAAALAVAGAADRRLSIVTQYSIMLWLSTLVAPPPLALADRALLLGTATMAAAGQRLLQGGGLATYPSSRIPTSARILSYTCHFHNLYVYTIY